MTSRPRLIHATRSGLRCHSESVTTVAPAMAKAVAGTPASRLPASPTRAVCVRYEYLLSGTERPRSATAAPKSTAISSICPSQRRSAPSTAINSAAPIHASAWLRSEEHTSELQSRGHLVCRLLLEKKKKIHIVYIPIKKKKKKIKTIK